MSCSDFWYKPGFAGEALGSGSSQGWDLKKSYREVTMANILYSKGNQGPVHEYGPDPVILRKRGISRVAKEKFELYKKKIEDPDYMEFAINKIALELTHFLSK
jgi:hypothetical protein